MRSGVDVDVAMLPEWDDRERDPVEEGLQQRVAGDVVRERLERQDEPMAEDVEGHVQ